MQRRAILIAIQIRQFSLHNSNTRGAKSLMPSRQVILDGETKRPWKHMRSGMKIVRGLNLNAISVVQDRKLTRKKLHLNSISSGVTVQARLSATLLCNLKGARLLKSVMLPLHNWKKLKFPAVAVWSNQFLYQQSMLESQSMSWSHQNVANASSVDIKVKTVQRLIIPVFWEHFQRN